MADLVERPTLEVALRDLDDREFFRRYASDRLLATILASRFRYVIRDVSAQLLKNAFSIIIRESMDFAAVLVGPRQLDWPMAAVSDSLPLFFGSMTDVVRNVFEEYGVDRLRPGDLLVCNDPYRVGTHVNDTSFARPIFHDGKLVGGLAIQAHMLDMGGMFVGGFDPTKQDVYVDGLQLPPMLIHSGEAPVKSVYSLIFDNTRFGGILLPDIQTIHESLRLGERLVLETIDRYGLEAYLGGIRYVCDASAERMRTAVERLPDGTYEGSDVLDCDAINPDHELHVKVAIKKAGRRLEVDLSGSSPATRAAINCGWLDIKTAVVVSLKYLLDPKGAFASGGLRDVDIVLPEGSLVNPLPPTCRMFYWEPLSAAMASILRALAPALGADAIATDAWSYGIHMAHGMKPDGMPWAALSSVGGGFGPWGATRHGDSDSHQLTYPMAFIHTGWEPVEADSPVVCLREEYVPDSAGPGKNRSGAAVAVDGYWLYEGIHRATNFHLKHPSGTGVHGGGDGSQGGVWRWDPDDAALPEIPELLPLAGDVYARAMPVIGVFNPETHALEPKGTYVSEVGRPAAHAKARTIFRHVTNGAGGWGDALEREPERVLRDVRDGYATLAGAARDYGVIVVGDPDSDPEGLVVDAGATERLRGTRRQGTPDSVRGH